jgi:hypothetical protein
VVHRAQVTLGDVRDSAAVRTTSHAAREAIEDVNATEDSSFLHRMMYRGAKSGLTRRLLETIRNAYFLPLIPVYGAQRDIERTLFTLAVIYGTHDNALGSIVASELQEISRALGISPAIITDYLQLADRPWEGAAPVPWRRLVGTEIPATAKADTWLQYFLELQQVYRSQAVSVEQLRRLQAEALPLLKVADAVRIKRKLAQIVAGVEEESPLVDVRKELSSRHLELGPPQWLRDQQVDKRCAAHGPRHRSAGGARRSAQLEPGAAPADRSRSAQAQRRSGLWV